MFRVIFFVFLVSFSATTAKINKKLMAKDSMFVFGFEAGVTANQFGEIKSHTFNDLVINNYENIESTGFYLYVSNEYKIADEQAIGFSFSFNKLEGSETSTLEGYKLFGETGKEFESQLEQTLDISMAIIGMDLFYRRYLYNFGVSAGFSFGLIILSERKEKLEINSGNPDHIFGKGYDPNYRFRFSPDRKEVFIYNDDLFDGKAFNTALKLKIDYDIELFWHIHLRPEIGYSFNFPNMSFGDERSFHSFSFGLGLEFQKNRYFNTGSHRVFE